MERIGIAGLTYMLIAFLCAPLAGQEKKGDQVNYSSGEKSFAEIKNAEGESCLDCHYLNEPDSINWNPSAMDLSGRAGYYRENGLNTYFNTPQGKLIQSSHSGVKLSEEQEKEITAYLEYLSVTPFVSAEPVKWKLILFIGMFVFLILLRIEKKRVKKLPGIIRRILVPVCWLVVLIIIVQDALAFNLSKNYAPVQPIKFSHSIHAADNKIDCNYCHPGVLKGKYAGVPPVSLCMNCHKHVEEGTRTGKFEIHKVRQAAEDSIPIRWVRISTLPDFTYFNHMQHVTVGGVDCITCHGDVEKMHIIKQVEDLSMGWCIKCHDKTKVDFSNNYYKTYYPALNDSLLTGRIDSILVSDLNGRECSVCHY